jgi:phage host-nuclease inhibitor protein Gam
VLAIDPKGDLSNVLLTFPNLAPEDFAPWVDPSDAAARGLTPVALAAMQAETWKKGLAEWEEDGARIARLKAAANVCVFTPGSRAGTPLALLKSLRAPAGEDNEDARARVTSTAASLLSLAGYTDLAPHNREQTLVAAILSTPSDPGTPADLAWLVQQIQRPSFDRVGVLDLDTFYPAKDRQDLALRFNSVLASPGFDVWLHGAPLDVGAMLFDEQGRPRVAVVSIAHLGDAERMLVVSLLFGAVLDWTRKQTGTGSLRALIYMDEVFGYLPPVQNPPSKLPLLTLLKQARAFGVGIVLATQNPVDLDYKALSNTGTWFLGKLQTERDKARVLDGLEGVTSGLNRQELDRSLSSLKSRVFLMHNVHEPGPVVFETRWTLSYLRGPMSRDELKRAIGPAAGAVVHPAAVTGAAAPASATEGGSPAVAPRPARPILPANVRELFLPSDAPTARQLVPTLYGSARIHYTDAKRDIDTVEDLHVTVPFSDGAVPVDWESAEPADTAPDALLSTPPASASSAAYGAPPKAALEAKQYSAWTKDFEQWILRAERLTLYSASSLKMTSLAGESERDFRIRLQQAARESKDAAVQKLRERYAPKVARLAQRLETAQEGVAREAHQAQQQKTQTAVSFGATVLGALFGRKAVSLSTLGRATTAVRGVGRAMKETQDVQRAQEKVGDTEAELKALEGELAEEIAALGATDAATADLETIEIRPKRGSVDVRLVALAWKPVA